MCFEAIYVNPQRTTVEPCSDSSTTELTEKLVGVVEAPMPEVCFSCLLDVAEITAECAFVTSGTVRTRRPAFVVCTCALNDMHESERCHSRK